MAVVPTKCRRCGGGMMNVHAETLSGSHAGIRLTLSNLPILECDRSGRRELPYSDFGSDVTLPIVCSDKYAVATMKWLFMKTPACSGCKQSLSHAATAIRRHAFDVQVEGFEPIGVILEASTAVCPRCEMVQILHDGQLEALVPAAAEEALSSGRIEV